VTVPPGPPAPGADAGLADAVVAAVRAVPGVARLDGGPHGEIAAYLPGRRVPGVRLRGDRAEVHVVLRWGVPVLAVADAVRDAVRMLTGTPVDVTVEDVVPAGEAGDVEDVGPTGQLGPAREITVVPERAPGSFELPR
jgi:uncharacterized alkaline shock family protein YloU